MRVHQPLGSFDFENDLFEAIKVGFKRARQHLISIAEFKWRLRKEWDADVSEFDLEALVADWLVKAVAHRIVDGHARSNDRVAFLREEDAIHICLDLFNSLAKIAG